MSPEAPRFEAIAPEHLPAVTALEQRAHAWPWQHRHFVDCLAADYVCQGLWRADTLLGHLVAMRGVDEVHLLNLAVDPPHQRQGWGTLMMGALALWALRHGLPTLWLEVRESNQRAIALYKTLGLRVVGVRKGYYPAAGGAREHAWVMQRDLTLPWPHTEAPTWA